MPARVAPKLTSFAVKNLGVWPTTAGDLRAAGEAEIVVGEINAQNYQDAEQFRRAFPGSLVVTLSGQTMIMAPLADIHFNSPITVDELVQLIKCLARQKRAVRGVTPLLPTRRVDTTRKVGEWTIYPQQFFAVNAGGEKLKLSQIGIQILELFLENPEVSFSRTHLVLMFGRADVGLKSRTIDQHLLLVRRILGRNQFRYLGYGNYTWLPEGIIPLSVATMKELARRT